MIFTLTTILYEILQWFNNTVNLDNKIEFSKIIPKSQKDKLNFQLTNNLFIDINNINKLPCSLDTIHKNLLNKEVQNIKPPNILIYSGKDDSGQLFEKIKKHVSNCINREKYTIYHLLHERVNKDPWTENVSLLMIASKIDYDVVGELFFQYFMAGGKILSFGSNFDDLLVKKKDVKTESMICNISYECKNLVPVLASKMLYNYPIVTIIKNIEVSVLATESVSNLPIIVSITNDEGGKAILSQAHLEKLYDDYTEIPEMLKDLKKDENVCIEILKNIFEKLGIDSKQTNIPDITPLNILSIKEKLKEKLIDQIKQKIVDNILHSSVFPLRFFPSSIDKPNSQIDTSSNYVNKTLDEGAYLVVSDPIDTSSFDMCAYSKNLNTRVLGNVVFYADVITSTMSVLDSLMFSCPQEVGLIATAKIQTQGKGRNQNEWLSPLGCAMFTCHLRVPIDSKLGKNISCVQHLVAIAAVQAGKSKLKLNDFNMRVKWPNDIYYGREVKLGGILVKTTTLENIYHMLIGCGVNVSNSKPTTCINSCIIDHLKLQDTRITSINSEAVDKEDELRYRDDELFTMEEYIAKLVSCLEKLVDDYQMNGPDKFMSLYRKYWLHENEIVTYQDGDVFHNDQILGIDEFGYLLVKQNHAVKRLDPDGNSFDLMKNLISVKVPN